MYIVQSIHLRERVQDEKKQERQKCPAGTRQTDCKNWGLVWRNRKKISQIIKDYFHLPFFLLIILWSLLTYACWPSVLSEKMKNQNSRNTATEDRRRAVSWKACFSKKKLFCQAMSLLFTWTFYCRNVPATVGSTLVKDRKKLSVCRHESILFRLRS